MVKILSRDSINRMVGRKNSVAGVGGGGGDVDLSGYATKIWTQETFVSIDFFRSLFRAYDSQNHEILPNGTTSTIDNIKAMFGFWTEQYLSALGQGSGGGGGGASALSDLLDVELTTLQNGQALIYSSAIGKWTNGTAGVNMTQVWSALDSATNEQINVSHLTNALSGYVTQTAAATTYLSKTDASTTYLSKTDASTTYLSIAFFNRLFQAYAGTGSSAVRVNPNDTTSTIDNIKAMFGFWTEQYLSALGQGTGGGGGGVGDVTWDLLADNSDTRQIALSHLTTALSGYALTSQIPTNNNQLTNGAGYITSSALSGYALTSQIPTNNNQLTNGAGYITSSAISDMATKTWAKGQFLKLSGGTLTGDLTVESVEIGHTNEINALQSSNLYLQYRNSGNLILCYNGANVCIGAMTTPSYKLHVSGSIGSSSLSIANGGRINVQGEPSGAVLYIGNSDNQGWVRVQDMCSQSGTAGDSSGWSIRTSGNALFANVQSNGYVTALSDARHKTIISDAAINVEQIARMPAVVYQWNDGREDNGLHVGSIAQDWQRVLPEVVMKANDEEGTLSMQYGVAALVSSIITARKVVDHERRIAELKRENKELKLKLKIV